jgi:hypothetical protein
MNAALTLTPAQILAMDNTAGNSVTIVPAPGPGLAVLVWDSWVNLQFNTKAYAGNPQTDLVLWMNNGGALVGKGTVIMPSSQLQASASQISTARLDPDFGGSSVAQLVNASVVLAMDTNNKFTGGDSDIVVSLTYDLVALS